MFEDKDLKIVLHLFSLKTQEEKNKYLKRKIGEFEKKYNTDFYFVQEIMKGIFVLANEVGRLYSEDYIAIYQKMREASKKGQIKKEKTFDKKLRRIKIENYSANLKLIGGKDKQVTHDEIKKVEIMVRLFYVDLIQKQLE